MGMKSSSFGFSTFFKQSYPLYGNEIELTFAKIVDVPWVIPYMGMKLKKYKL